MHRMGRIQVRDHLRHSKLMLCKLSLVVVNGSYFSLRYVGFSLQWLLLFRSTGSRCVGSVLAACRLQRVGSVVVVQGLSCTWNPPEPRIEPMCPALASEFLTIEPPRKPCFLFQKGHSKLFYYSFFNHSFNYLFICSMSLMRCSPSGTTVICILDLLCVCLPSVTDTFSQIFYF